MIREVEAGVARLRLAESTLIGRSGEIVGLRKVVYFTAAPGGALARLEDGRDLDLAGNLNALEKDLRGLFLRVHRSYLVAVDRITGTFRRFPDEGETEEEEPKGGTKGPERGVEDECELELRDGDRRIPVTPTYAQALRKALGAKTLRYAYPEHPDDKKLRLYGLIDFGWRELYNLDPTDAPAVAAFKERWDVRTFPPDRMLGYFRRFGVNEIDKRRVIKNILYQMFRWIRKGIEPPSDGNIRSLWYRIKAILSYHSDVLGPGDVDVYYATLQEMVEEKNLFRYKDFGFMDMNEPYRGIGARAPHVVLASEKIGHYLFIRKLAAEFGASFICLKGEPAVISMEYFSDDLAAACGSGPKEIFSISDIDPAGYSIEGNLVEGLRSRGHEIGRVVKLVDPSVFTSEEIAVVRYPVVTFDAKGDQVKPQPPATAGQVTKARAWFEAVADERLYTEKDKGGGWKTVTIWGIESDAADREIITKRFREGIGG